MKTILSICLFLVLTIPVALQAQTCPYISLVTPWQLEIVSYNPGQFPIANTLLAFYGPNGLINLSFQEVGIDRDKKGSASVPFYTFNFSLAPGQTRSFIGSGPTSQNCWMTVKVAAYWLNGRTMIKMFPGINVRGFWIKVDTLSPTSTAVAMLNLDSSSAAVTITLEVPGISGIVDQTTVILQPMEQMTMYPGQFLHNMPEGRTPYNLAFRSNGNVIVDVVNFVQFSEGHD